ncbi:MAG: helix-turn-helix transcriptional regulator [Candidatus Methanoplasma sp.]|nr:helix-turn-helix transcriptional regulator [Candidatus Methanoplasma sp.]
MFSYAGLWKLLIEKEINRTQLRIVTGIGTTTFAKMSKKQPVSLRVLAKICSHLECDIGDIIHYEPDECGGEEGDN